MHTAPFHLKVTNMSRGRPSASHYFVGVQDSNFFYLDPHIIRPALALRVNVEEYTNSEIDSCHTRRLRLISIKEMDPSMLISFLIRDEQDWHQWRTAVASSSFKAIIHIADSDPSITKNGGEREGAIDEVESFDGDAEEEDDVTILNA
jgi:cysteine protease ATG4